MENRMDKKNYCGKVREYDILNVKKRFEQKELDTFLYDDQPNTQEKVLIIASCSKTKSERSCKVRNFYKGQQFNMIKSLCERNGFDWLLISGYYGLLFPDDHVKPYDLKLSRDSNEITRVRNKTLPKLKKIIPSYDKIVVIMGKNYRNVIKPLFDDKFYIIFHKKGLFEYNSLLSFYNKISKRRFLIEIEKFKYIN